MMMIGWNGVMIEKFTHTHSLNCLCLLAFPRANEFRNEMKRNLIFIEVGGKKINLLINSPSSKITESEREKNAC